MNVTRLTGMSLPSNRALTPNRSAMRPSASEQRVVEALLVGELRLLSTLSMLIPDPLGARRRARRPGHGNDGPPSCSPVIAAG